MSATIALDAMGGDHGVSVTVPAALAMLKKHPELRLILVGRQDEIAAELARQQRTESGRLRVQHAGQVVAMDEPPTQALRAKKDSSMRVAVNLVKTGEASACVSAGNTGALMATARFVLKTLPGIDRPAIMTALPTITGHVHVLDLGANVDCTPEQLLQFGIMGSILVATTENQIFTGLADDHTFHLRVIELFTNGPLGVCGGFPPEVRRVSDFDLPVMDKQINRFVRLAFDHQVVKTGPGHFRGEKSSHVAASQKSGQGGFGHDMGSGRCRSAGGR